MKLLECNFVPLSTIRRSLARKRASCQSRRQNERPCICAAQKNVFVRHRVVQYRAMPMSRTAVEWPHPGAPLAEFERFVEDGGGALLATGYWGLEREVLRIEADGQPALTPHPFPPD